MNLTSSDILEISGNSNPREKLSQWDFTHLITDLYKLRSADSLALEDIPQERIEDYRILISKFALLKPQDSVATQFQLMFSILHKFYERSSLWKF